MSNFNKQFITIAHKKEPSKMLCLSSYLRKKIVCMCNEGTSKC